MAAADVSVAIVMSTLGTYEGRPTGIIDSVELTVERGETSLVTRDSVETAVLDAMSALMDRLGL